MEITYLGHSSFRLKGKSITIITDPYDGKAISSSAHDSLKVGLKFPKIEANIVTLSHDHEDHNQEKQIIGEPKVVRGPGEYEIGGISIFGIPSYHDNKHGEERGPNTIYAITVEGVNICHLGDLGHKLTDEHLEQIGNVDVLLIPVGGVYTIDASGACEAVTQLEPKVVIPMHYKVPGLKYELEEVEAFVKEIGIEPTRDTKFVITTDKIPEEMQLVVLERKA